VNSPLPFNDMSNVPAEPQSTVMMSPAANAVRLAQMPADTVTTSTAAVRMNPLNMADPFVKSGVEMYDDPTASTFG
jgi:hypothetical protein